MKGLVFPGIALTLLVIVLAVPGAHSQRTEARRGIGSVTYVSSTSVYVGAGTKAGLAAGDTLTIMRSSQQVAVAVISAVSSSSSSAQVIAQVKAPAVGDSVFATTTVQVESPLEPRQPAETLLPGHRRAVDPGQNIVTGRVALQYGMATVVGKQPDYAVPAAVVRLDVARLFGTALMFSLHGRTSYDLQDRSSFSPQGSRLHWRVYALSLTYEDPQAWYGYSLGRVMSRYVGGLGVFDGGQAFVRMGGLSVGALGGVQPDPRTSALDTDHQKFAAFVNYAWGGDVFTTSDITLAYGQEMLKGKLDRDFLYLQTSLRFGSTLFLYQSTELDLHSMAEDQRKPGIGFTNGFITLTYNPLSWLTVNGGYDATRTVYLLETMKSIADTLLDRSLKEGFRGSVGFHLPMHLVLALSGNLRLASGTTPSAHTLGGTLRASDILGSGVNLGGGYARIQGLYTAGDNVTVDVDTWISQRFTATLRVDHFRYTTTGQDDRLRTLTASATLSYMFSRSLYCMLNFDQVWDSVQDAQRVYVEMGVHF